MNKLASQAARQVTATPLTAPILQRKCECGNHTPAGGECQACGKQQSTLQRKTIAGANVSDSSPPQVADQVVANNTAPSSVSSLAFGRLQREEAPKEKTNEEKYQEGLEKLGEAFLKTPLGKELLEKIKQDTLVKGATELGKDFISTWPGKIVTGAAATGAVAALAATHKELPAQIPEIPLDVLTPGLSVQLTYKGPVDKPTEAMITFKFSEQAPKGRDDKKPMSATDKFRAETARLAAENAKFRAGMTYEPGSAEDLQQAEQEATRNAVLKYSGGPDIEATIKKYPWLATPQPKTFLQLTLPKPYFGIKPPALLGDEFKLKPPSEQRKKEDGPSLQKKLSIGASNDPLEQEADRVADQVLAAPAHPPASVAPVRIQRFTGQLNEGTDTAPASVDRVLASSGRPLESTLRQDMEQRFGHDFSRVRVHTGGEAEQSAREVNANAYTAGHNVVFGATRFAPGTPEGRRLIAHELTHVVQQSSSDGVLVNNNQRGLSSIITLGMSRAVVQRENLSTAQNQAKVAEKAEAQDAINMWSQNTNKTVLDICAWYSDNYIKYLTNTGLNRQLSWTDGMLFDVLQRQVGSGFNLAAGAVAGAALGIEVGSAGGPPGVIVGFIVGTAVGSVVRAIAADIKETALQRAEAATQTGAAIDAATNRFISQAQKGQSKAADVYNRVQKTLSATTDMDVIFRIRDWAISEMTKLKSPLPGDTSLFEQMYADWVLEHAAPGGAGKGTDPVQWAVGEKNAKGLLGKGLADHPDLFGYQTRGHWSAAGLPTARAQDMIEQARGRSTDVMTLLFQQFAGKTYTFGVAEDPFRLQAFIVKNTKIWFHSEAFKSSNFTIQCSLNLRPALPGTLMVVSWDYRVTLPEAARDDFSELYATEASGLPPKPRNYVGGKTITENFSVSP